MTTRWAVRPLDKKALKKANEAVWKKMSSPRKLTMGPKDETLRNKWMDAYIDAGGKAFMLEIGEPVIECAPDLGTLFVFVWACDGSALEGAEVSIQGPEARQGLSDANGVAFFPDLTAGDYEIRGFEDRNGEDTTITSLPALATQSCDLNLRIEPAEFKGADQVKELWKPKDMDRLICSEFWGGNSKGLRNAMETLAGEASPAQVDAALDEIAALRFLDKEAVREQYRRFLGAQCQANAIRNQKTQGGQKVDEVPPLSESHGDFMGSTSQLRFGKQVGDAFDPPLDAVFGALLSPTGGMVGPGNSAWEPWDDSPVGYHGVVHDAAGYLYNYHDQGPGYDYLDKSWLETSNCLAGQVDGTSYWIWRMNQPDAPTAGSSTPY